MPLCRILGDASRALLPVAGILAGVLLSACHAQPDDPAGQAGELSDAVRREYALSNIVRLYTTALSRHDGDRNHAEVKGIADATIDKLVQAYVDHPEDTVTGGKILDLLYEMRDARAIPALIKGFKWRAEVTEEHAIRAAQTVRSMPIPEAQKGPLIEALGEALGRVTQARAPDNRMRIEFIRALGSLEDRAAAPVLGRIVTTQTEEQNFLINRLAAQQLGRLRDPASVPALVKALFLFAPNNPAMRMDDVATEALVQIGRPALDPLLAVLRGENQEANQLVQATIDAVRARDAQAAQSMSAESIRSYEATFALGWLGFRDALDPILAEVNSDSVDRRLYGLLGVLRLTLEAADIPRVREAVQRVYESAPLEQKMQLLAAIRHLYDGELLPFFLAQVRNMDEHPEVRLEAVKAYALLSNKAEAAALRAAIEREAKSEDGGYKERFEENLPALVAADECDADVTCWIGKLAAREPLVLQKATYMLGRYARGNDRAITALVERLGHTDIEVRGAAIEALDRVAIRGSVAAVAKIDELQEREEGRAVWNAFRAKALPVQARLRMRQGED